MKKTNSSQFHPQKIEYPSSIIIWEDEHYIVSCCSCNYVEKKRYTEAEKRECGPLNKCVHCEPGPHGRYKLVWLTGYTPKTTHNVCHRCPCSVWMNVVHTSADAIANGHRCTRCSRPLVSSAFVLGIRLQSTGLMRFSDMPERMRERSSPFHAIACSIMAEPKEKSQIL